MHSELQESSARSLLSLSLAILLVRIYLGLQDMHNELQDVMGQSFGVPDDIDEDDLMGELDALEDELAMESENPTAGGVPSYLQVLHQIVSSSASLIWLDRI